MHLHHEYGLLAPEETRGGPANAGAQVRGAVHGAISGTADDWWTETEMGEETGQRTLLARGMQENGNEDQIPPNQSRALNTCGHQGGEGGGRPLTRQRVPTVLSQGSEGDPHTLQ